MMSEDSDYTSDINYPVQQQYPYYITGPGPVDDDVDAYCLGAGYYPDDVGDYLPADRRYYYHQARPHQGLARADDRWLATDRHSGRDRNGYWNVPTPQAYQRHCDWEQEPLSYNSRPPRYHSCHRSVSLSL